MSPPSGRSTLMTSAPISASWREQNGAATACSSATTRRPCNGRAFISSLLLKRSWHVQHMLAQIRQNEIGRDGCDLIQARLTELTLNVIFSREAKASVRLQTYIGSLPGSIGSQQFRHVRLGTAGLSRVKEACSLIAHQISSSHIGI